jgi:hypothetical protein
MNKSTISDVLHERAVAYGESAAVISALGYQMIRQASIKVESHI